MTRFDNDFAIINLRHRRKRNEVMELVGKAFARQPDTITIDMIDGSDMPPASVHNLHIFLDFLCDYHRLRLSKIQLGDGQYTRFPVFEQVDIRQGFAGKSLYSWSFTQAQT